MEKWTELEVNFLAILEKKNKNIFDMSNFTNTDTEIF